MNDPSKGMTLVHITTIPESLGFLAGQIGYMKERGFQVHGLAAPGEYLEEFGEREGIPVHAVPMARRITPLRDLATVLRIRRELRRIRPQIAHAHTPKGGLLGMIGAWLAGVPVRIYHIHGLPMLTAAGWKRSLLRWTEKVSCRLASQVLCVSHSVREVAVREGLCPAGKIKVLLGGSINGVDADGRFNPAKADPQLRSQTRAKYGIPEDALVAGFVGRIVRDKGVIELVEAWRAVSAEYPGLHLLVAGMFEPQDPIPPETERVLREDPRIHLTGHDWDIVPLYAALDLVVLPTYREGFNVVCMETGAMALPIVTTAVPGTDAVVDGRTGTKVPAQDSEALAGAVRAYLADPELRKAHGQAARERMLREFRREAIWEATYREYARLLGNRGLCKPGQGPGSEEVCQESSQ